MTIKLDFFSEMNDFIQDNNMVCNGTLGLAPLVYATSILASRTVALIGECFETTKTTDTLNEKILCNETLTKSKSKEVMSLAMNNLLKESLTFPSTKRPCKEKYQQAFDARVKDATQGKIIELDFYSEMDIFIHFNKKLCVVTLGVAPLIYGISLLSNRVITWINACFGITKTVDILGQKVRLWN